MKRKKTVIFDHRPGSRPLVGSKGQNSTFSEQSCCISSKRNQNAAESEF